MYGKISHPRMGNYHPRVRRDLAVTPRGNSCWLHILCHNPQPTLNQPVGFGFIHVTGDLAVAPRGNAVLVSPLPCCGIMICSKRLLIIPGRP